MESGSQDWKTIDLVAQAIIGLFPPFVFMFHPYTIVLLSSWQVFSYLINRFSKNAFWYHRFRKPYIRILLAFFVLCIVIKALDNFYVTTAAIPLLAFGLLLLNSFYVAITIRELGIIKKAASKNIKR